VHDGKITFRAVADALRLPYTPATDLLRLDARQVAVEPLR
jgi:hypothetical protein